MKKLWLMLVVVLSWSCVARAGYLLYDFAQPWQYEEWQTADPATQRCFPSTKYAVQGKNSLGFIGMKSDRKCLLTGLVWDNDWSHFEYVSLVITNPTSQVIPLTISMANEQGYLTWITLEPMSCKEYVVRIKFPKYARINNILTLTLQTEEPMDAEFYVDKIQLHKKDQEPKVEGEKRKRDVTGYPITSISEQLDAQLKNRVAENCKAIGTYFDGLMLDMPAAREALLRRALELQQAISKDELSQDEKIAILRESEQLTMSADRFVQIKQYVSDSDVQKPGGFLIGFADSMTKVMPRDVKVKLDLVDEVSVSLAGNEKESVQLAVVPFARDVKKVSVVASDLKDAKGNVIPTRQVEIDLVSFVKTHGISDSYPRYIGWYPEPLIANPKPVDVAIGDIQTWWIRIRTMEDQKPGLYHGQITVNSQDVMTRTIKLNVEVYDFNMPRTAPIPTAITYDAYKHPSIGDNESEKWKTLKYKHADFLADYMLNFDSIYRNKQEKMDWDVLKYIADKGQLSAINLGYFYSSSDQRVAEFKYNYDKVRELGLLDYCYIYGFDEAGYGSYKSLEEAAKKFKKAYPEVLVLTTAQDHSYGFDGEAPTVTGWCPIINRYNPTLAQKAHKAGRRVWWYTCNWPKAPYPNVYVDYPAIDLRVLMGLFHAKYQPDGFLYYHTSIFGKNNDQGISTYPFTNWDPYNFVKTNGDGQLYCISDQGMLVPTLRLENYRDGLEDLAYFMILQHQVKTYELQGGKETTWYSTARRLLDQPNQLVKTRYRYTTDPQTIRTYRKALANAIQDSPIKDTNLWKNGLSIWGLDGRPKN